MIIRQIMGKKLDLTQVAVTHARPTAADAAPLAPTGYLVWGVNGHRPQLYGHVGPLSTPHRKNS